MPIQPDGAHGIQIQGFSLKPLLDNPAAAKWDGPKVALTSDAYGELPGPSFAVRSEHYRYILTPSGQEEFYDLETDANEWVNQAGNPAHAKAKAEMKAELLKLAYNHQGRTAQD